MNLKSIVAAIAIALTTVAGAASAAEIVLTPTGPGSFAGSFTQMASGLFIDDFTFLPMAFNGTASVTLASLAGPVTFFAAVFFPDTAGEIAFPNPTDVVGGSFSVAAPVTSSVPLSLRVFGAATDATGSFVDGRYSVSVVAAVPEPQTYALLLAGLLGVGIAARRRAG